MGDACAGESPVVTRPMPEIYKHQSHTVRDVYVTIIPGVRAATATQQAPRERPHQSQALDPGPSDFVRSKPSPACLAADAHEQACSLCNIVCILRLATVFV
jgi:hypothetical protein